MRRNQLEPHDELDNTINRWVKDKQDVSPGFHSHFMEAVQRELREPEAVERSQSVKSTPWKWAALTEAAVAAVLVLLGGWLLYSLRVENQRLAQNLLAVETQIAADKIHKANPTDRRSAGVLYYSSGPPREADAAVIKLLGDLTEVNEIFVSMIDGYSLDAKRGNVRSMVVLSLLYASGLDSRKDKEKAKYWYNKAKVTDEAAAKSYLDKYLKFAFMGIKDELKKYSADSIMQRILQEP